MFIMNSLEILKKLVSIDSQCTKSNKEIIEYISSLLSKFEVKKIRFKSKDGKLDLFNLIVKIPGIKHDNPLVFVGHVDTVPVSPGWRTPPFTPLEKSGKIYGLGSSDMKAGIACILASALNLNQLVPQDIFLLFDADEEGSLSGGNQMIKDFTSKNARIIVAEPTNQKIIYSQKGCIDLEITTGGIATHSSKADFEYNHKKNALYKTVRICCKLINYGKEIENRKGIFGTKPTLNIGKIEGGVAANVVANKCKITINRRLTPNENIKEVYQEIVKIVKETDPDAKINPIFWGESFETKKDGKFIKHIEGISKKIFEKEIEYDINLSWTEAALFYKYGEVVVFGPGLREQAHQINEYCEVESLKKYSEIYSKLMRGD